MIDLLAAEVEAVLEDDMAVLTGSNSL